RIEIEDGAAAYFAFGDEGLCSFLAQRVGFEGDAFAHAVGASPVKQIRSRPAGAFCVADAARRRPSVVARLLFRLAVGCHQRGLKTHFCASSALYSPSDGPRYSKNGGADRDQTGDLVVANDALYQLSYCPVQGRWFWDMP